MKLQESQTLVWPRARKTLNTNTTKFCYILYIPILVMNQELKIVEAEYKILIYIVLKINPHIFYIHGDMIRSI